MSQITEAMTASFGKIALYIVIMALVILAVALILALVKRSLNKSKKPIVNQGQAINLTPETPDTQKDYTQSYKPRWLLSENEKNAYRNIKAVTDDLGLPLFSKVRLFDLVEPKDGTDNYKAAMWKVQAKHVDFVICNQYLDAKIIIELDDGSHQRADRKERDEFVDDVLTNTGYTIIHANYINPDQLRKIITEIIPIKEESRGN